MRYIKHTIIRDRVFYIVKKQPIRFMTGSAV